VRYNRAEETFVDAFEQSREWFHSWWRCYQSMGVAGLYDMTRAAKRFLDFTRDGTNHSDDPQTA